MERLGHKALHAARTGKGFPILRGELVHAEHGWWFPEQEASEPSLFGTFDSNPNNCTRAFETDEGGIGSPIKSMICRIYPCHEGDVLPGEQVTRRGGFGDYTKGAMSGSKVD